ncbi:class E sortase [Streptomyces sp. NPDC093221]|uniref:class E sortase n=1 Tax=Streptomyces sp. NPDC093221 TaxID=3366032 RepID=UPI00380B7AE2
MTTLRPERPSDGPMSYEDTGQFKAVVEQLDDPLNDPLPGRPPAVPEPSYDEPAYEKPVFDEPVFPEPAYEKPVFDEPAYEEPVFDEPAAPWFVPEEPPQAAPPPPAPPPVRPVTADEELDLGTATVVQPVVRPVEQPAVEPPADDVLESVFPTTESAPEPAPEPAGPGPGPAPGPVLGPDGEGGRAARRKAAQAQQRGGAGHGGHRARGRTPGGAAGAAPAGAVPLSRVEARRAAKAAKESPAVVVSRIVGELFITTGVLMLLFVTYQLWWTNVRAHQQASGAANNLQHQWDATKDDPNRVPGTFSPGQGFAIMYIPKLDVKAPIAQGVSKHNVLDKGMIGHYDGVLNTAMPWDKSGNFAVAAHRNTHGEPFRYINHLVPGDKVVVETADTYYTYEITSSLASTPPSNISVIKPVPTGSGFTGPGRYLTLTTCTPEFTSTNRLIVWGKLTEERPRSKGKPDALVE